MKTYQIELMTKQLENVETVANVNENERERNSDTWWRRTTATFLVVSFGTYRRRRRDVVMGHRGYVPLRRLGEVPLRRCWVFHLRLV